MSSHDPFRRPPPRPMVPRLGRDLATGPCRVLAYVDRYPPFVNAGAEWMLHAMLADSVRRGHDVTVATPCCDEATTLDGVTVEPVSALPDYIRDAEVLVGHLLYTREVIGVARGEGLPLLYVVHNDAQLRHWRLSRDDVSALVWNSEWIAAAGRAYGDTLGVPATTVRPPLDCSTYRPDAPAPGDREFVTLVNPIAAKGSELFYALARRDSQRRFLAVEGAYGSQQRPRAEDRNVEWQRQTATIGRDVLARTRVLLMPSRYESWGRAAVEALCSGIPVLASPTPGLVEALGDAGIFPGDDLADWRSALAELDDPDRYAEASAAALARAAELEAVAALDLERWDRLVRLAAGGHRVRSGRMTTTPYDPFRGGRRHRDARAQPAEAGGDPASAGTAPTGSPPAVPRTAAEWVAAWLSDPRGVVQVEVQRANVEGANDATEDEWEPIIGVGGLHIEPGQARDDDAEAVLDVLTDDDVAGALTPWTPVVYRVLLVYADGSAEAVAHSVELPVLSDAEEGAVEPLTAIRPDGGPDTAPGPEAATEPPIPADWTVPDKAVAIVHALKSEKDPDTARAMAEAVQAAEAGRDTPRKSVLAAVADVLG